MWTLYLVNVLIWYKYGFRGDTHLPSCMFQEGRGEPIKTLTVPRSLLFSNGQAHRSKESQDVPHVTTESAYSERIPDQLVPLTISLTQKAQTLVHVPSEIRKMKICGLPSRSFANFRSNRNLLILKTSILQNNWAYNWGQAQLSTVKVKAGTSEVRDQLWLQSKFKVSLDYTRSSNSTLQKPLCEKGRMRHYL